MGTLRFNLLLALLWMIWRGMFGPADLLVGFVLGFLAIITVQRFRSDAGQRNVYLLQSWYTLELIIFMAWTMGRANLALAQIALMQGVALRPGIVAVPLDLQSSAAIALLAHLISLTPGTLSLHLASDERTLYVHTVHLYRADLFRKVIKRELEWRVARLLGA